MTLLEQTVQRLTPIVGIDSVFILASRPLADTFYRSLPQFGPNIILEPEKKNTAGAIVWGTALLSSFAPGKELTFGIFPADHRISDVASFETSVQTAFQIAEEQDKLVTIGIAATRPDTGYGYISRGKEIAPSAYQVDAFLEKPDEKKAASLIASQKVFWNGGMFFWTASTFRAELERAAPEFADALDAMRNGIPRRDPGTEAILSGLPSISIDHLLMEKSKNVAVVEGSFEWDDMGSWHSLERLLDKDEQGNAVYGPARLIDCRNCIVYNSSLTQEVSLLGLEDCIVVVEGTSILVCPKSRASEVRAFQAIESTGEPGR